MQKSRPIPRTRMRLGRPDLKRLLTPLKTLPRLNWRWIVHFGLIGLEIILVVGIVRYGWFPVQSGTPWWSQISPEVTLVGGIVALLTYFYTRAQTREHFDRKELQDEFTDILDRFADKDSPLMRANAAIRLAGIAERNLPGKSQEYIPENYPFFGQAAAQLAAALHMETDQAVRDEVTGAVKQMATFTLLSNAGKLSTLLLTEVIDANLKSKEMFIEKLGEYCALYDTPPEDYLKQIVGFANFCELEKTTLMCLQSLAESEKCRASITIQILLREAQKWDRNAPPSPDLLIGIRSAADCLIITRDALKDCIMLRPMSAHIPCMNKCFLSGADLGDAQLQGADLGDAQLQGANLRESQLQGATLCDAVIEGGAIPLLPLINFRGANWWQATFQLPFSEVCDTMLRDRLQELYPKPDSTSPLLPIGPSTAQTE